MTTKRKTPSHRSLFTVERNGKMPLVLIDGTSVEFPVDWSKIDAENWRQRAGLSKPRKFRARISFRAN